MKKKNNSGSGGGQELREGGGQGREALGDPSVPSVRAPGPGLKTGAPLCVLAETA